MSAERSLIGRLRAAADEIEARCASPATAALVAALRRVEIEGKYGLTIDAALGLSPAIWATAGNRRRDELIAEAANWYGGRSGGVVSYRQLAKEVLTAARAAQRLAAPRNDGERLIADALKAGKAFPSCERRVQQILKEQGVKCEIGAC
jgi:hypothetical protein